MINATKTIETTTMLGYHVVKVRRDGRTVCESWTKREEWEAAAGRVGEGALYQALVTGGLRGLAAVMKGGE